MSIRASERFIAVGDIHGDAKRLSALLDLITNQEARLVFLGDYINRGPASKVVIQLLLDLRDRRPDTVFLLGNHESALLRYLQGGEFASFARMGGIATIRSYIPGIVNRDVRGHLTDTIPQSHKDFITNLRLYWENDAYLFSHLGFDPDNPSVRSVDAMALENHPRILLCKGISGKVAVFGHYLQQSQRPFIATGLVCLDTGCGTRNGPLSAMLFPDRLEFSI